MPHRETMNELIAYSATQQARLIRERRVSSRELVAAHLERIAAINPKINAAIQVLTESALAEAAAADASEPRGPLHGVPFSIKDSLELAGTVVTAGTLGRKNAPPSTEDATLVERLRRAGAIPIAKTNLPDLLFAFESDNLIFGATRNPYDTARQDNIHTTRTGLCLTHDRAIGYFFGADLSAEALGRAMIQAH